MSYLSKAQQLKLAGSQLYITPGEESIESKKRLTPSIKYHYTAQGKYALPGVTGSLKNSNIAELIQYKDSRGYVAPEHREEFIKRYDQDVKNTIAMRAGRWEKNPNRTFLDKLRGVNKKKVVEDPGEVEQVYNNPEFQQEHQEVLNYMRKQKGGFTLHLG